jgi:hypothetical protein
MSSAIGIEFGAVGRFEVEVESGVAQSGIESMAEEP